MYLCYEEPLGGRLHTQRPPRTRPQSESKAHSNLSERPGQRLQAPELPIGRRDMDDPYNPLQIESHYHTRTQNKTTHPRYQIVMPERVAEWQEKLPARVTGLHPAIDAVKLQGSVPQPQAIDPTPPRPATIGSNATKPICSLNLICYRPGSQGCVLRQIRVTSLARFDKKEDYTAAVEANDGIVTTDIGIFKLLWKEYNQHMCGFWRRYLSLKTLRQIRLLTYTSTSRPAIVPLDDFTLQEIFHAYNNPATIETDDEWINWVFQLRPEDRRHALEFVEGWSGFRIGIVGSIPWVAATVVGVTWVAKGGDAQTAFTVAAFILTVGTSWLALLAIVSKIEL